MNRSKSALPAGFLALLLIGSHSLAQDWTAVNGSGQTAPQSPSAPLPPAPKPPTNEPWLPDFLQRMPHPPDEMKSLYQAGETTPDTSAVLRPEPYFQPDPLLDPPNMPRVGWFASVEMMAGVPHIFQSISGPVAAGSLRPNDTVSLPNRGLDWTYIPQVELGYNLPSGFGGLGWSFRYLATSGNYQIFGPDGLAPLNSRMSLYVGGLDYISKQITPNDTGDRWTMRWRLGVRMANLYYDSTLNQAPATAAAGTGILQQHVSNLFLGGGPHVALELTHQLVLPGLSVLGRADFSNYWGAISQGQSETAFDPTSPTGVSFGSNKVSSSQTAPVVNLLMGLDYQPPRWSNVHIFTGYQYENWWNVGRYSLDGLSRGDMTIQGFVLRFECNY